MVDLATWRAVIGSFSCQFHARSKVKRRQPCLFTCDNTDADTAKTRAITTIDVVIFFLLMGFTVALVSSLARNIANLKSIDPVVFDCHVYTKSTILCTKIDGHVTPLVCQIAVHVKMLLSVCCAVHALYPRRRLSLCPDVQKNPGPNNNNQPEDSNLENPAASSLPTVDLNNIATTVMQAIQTQLTEHRQATQKQLDDQTILIRNDLGDIKEDLAQVKQQYEEISKRCERLEDENLEMR